MTTTHIHVQTQASSLPQAASVHVRWPPSRSAHIGCDLAAADDVFKAARWGRTNKTQLINCRKLHKYAS